MYREKRGNLFEGIVEPDRAPDGVFYAQCVSVDGEMGAGIALEFNRYFDVKNKFEKRAQEFMEIGIDKIQTLQNNESVVSRPFHGYTYYINPCVLNVVTKIRYWEKPSLEEFKNAVKEMVNVVEDLKLTKHIIKEIRCPMLGCGIDKLHWSDVRDILVEVAADLDLLGVDLTVIDLRLPVVGDNHGKEDQEEKR